VVRGTKIEKSARIATMGLAFGNHRDVLLRILLNELDSAIKRRTRIMESLRLDADIAEFILTQTPRMTGIEYWAGRVPEDHHFYPPYRNVDIIVQHLGESYRDHAEFLYEQFISNTVYDADEIQRRMYAYFDSTLAEIKKSQYRIEVFQKAKGRYLSDLHRYMIHP
jgi:hypothetical protein